MADQVPIPANAHNINGNYYTKEIVLLYWFSSTQVRNFVKTK